jgi:hypothetical protein
MTCVRTDFKTGHCSLVAVLGHPQDTGGVDPGGDRLGQLPRLVRNTNNVAWRNFHVVEVLPDPGSDPGELPFLLAGAPGVGRRFDLQIAVHLPADARLLLEVPAGAAAVLPPRWRDLLRPGRHDDYVVELPSLRSNALCGAGCRGRRALVPVRCPALPGPGREGPRRGNSQFDGDLQVGGVTWALRPRADAGREDVPQSGDRR